MATSGEEKTGKVTRSLNDGAPESKQCKDKEKQRDRESSYCD